MKKNISLILVLSVIFAAIAFTAPYFCIQYINSNMEYGSQIDPFENNLVWILAGILFVGLWILAGYTLTKYKLFNFSKTINRVDRAESDAFGSSRWQTQDEMKKNYGNFNFAELGIEPAEGYVLRSELHGRKLMLSMIPKQHCLVVGTSGTGKSAFYLGTTIQANAASKTKASMIINDLKGELFTRHSKALQDQGYNIIKIDLRNPHTSSRYNPLSLIYDLYQEYQENRQAAILDRASVYINEVAAALCPIGSGDQQQWSQGAQAIIKAVIWGMLEDSVIPEFELTRDKFTILQISNIVNRQKNDLENFLRHRNQHSPVFDFAGMILDNPSEKTVGSYYATLSTALEGFLEPGIQKITSGTDVDVTKIATNPTAFFIIIPDELKTRNVIGTMIISQIYNYLVFQASMLPGEVLEKNVYFLLDEFGNLPKIQNFPQWVSLSRGRGIFFNLLLQADSQLEEVYGKSGATTILQNCQLQLLLGANEIATLKRFGDLFGKYTIYQRSANIDTDKSITEYKGSTGITSKDLITLDQLQRIPVGTGYFKLLRHHPCQTNFVPIFDKAVATLLPSGSATIATQITSEVNRATTYYDLSEREATYQMFLQVMREEAEAAKKTVDPQPASKPPAPAIPPEMRFPKKPKRGGDGSASITDSLKPPKPAALVAQDEAAAEVSAAVPVEPQTASTSDAAETTDVALASKIDFINT